jgi:hypothetical protein
VPARSTGRPADRAFSGSVGAVRRALQERRPVVANDIAHDAFFAGRASVVSHQLRALVCLPLFEGDRTLGAIYADRTDAGPPITTLDIELLQAFAEHAAVWIAARRATTNSRSRPTPRRAGAASWPRRRRSPDATPRSRRHRNGAVRAADLPAGTMLAGRFRIEKLLGLGGMGMVYRATDTALGVPCALKVLRPELMHREDATERFRQELLLRAPGVESARRAHPRPGAGQRALVLTMDYVEGESLDRRLDREGASLGRRCPAHRAPAGRWPGRRACARRVHRDLKPANILLDAEGNAYISDFGVARSLAGNGMTRSGAIVGTPDYVSPEQAPWRCGRCAQRPVFPRPDPLRNARRQVALRWAAP